MIITDLYEAPQLCPECGGISFSDLILAEKKDACYYKVKASAKVWPSAYASGRLVQCRKKGADNYGNKNESEDDNFGKPAAWMKASPEALKTAQSIVQKQADKNVIGQAKIAGAVPSQGVAEGFSDSRLVNLPVGNRNRPLPSSRPWTDEEKKKRRELDDARIRAEREKQKQQEKKQGVAEGSNELYQKAIRKYAQQVANDYLGGGNDYLYGANKFDSEMFGVDPKQAQQDFKTLFAQLTKQQGVAEGEYKSRHIHRQEQNKKYDEYRRNQEAQGKKPLSRGDWAATQRKGQQGVAEGSVKAIKDIESKIRQLYQRKTDRENAGDPYVGHELHSYYSVRKQLLDKKKRAQSEYHRKMDSMPVEGVAEGSNDTIYPNAEVIKSKNGKPVGEIYQDGNSWGAFHYRADRGYDLIDSREDAIEALKDLHQETGRSRPDYTIKGVTEAINPDITNPEFSHQQQIGDYLYVARYWSKGLKITAYHGNKQIGYAELMYQSAPFDDFADPKTTPKRIWLESEWTRVDPKYQRQGIMSTMYAYAKMLGNSVKPSQTRSDDAKAAWKSWRQSGDAQHLTREGVAEGMENSPVADAMFARLQQRPDLLRRYGVEYVIQAVHDVADSVGAVDEIGSSDVSGYMRQLEWNLKNKLNQYDEPMSDIDRLEEVSDEKIAGRYEPEKFDAMVGRLKQLAGAGPRKTVWDPVKRVYKTVPVNTQPQADK